MCTQFVIVTGVIESTANGASPGSPWAFSLSLQSDAWLTSFKCMISVLHVVELVCCIGFLMMSIGSVMRNEYLLQVSPNLQPMGQADLYEGDWWQQVRLSVGRSVQELSSISACYWMLCCWCIIEHLTQNSWIRWAEELQASTHV